MLRVLKNLKLALAVIAVTAVGGFWLQHEASAATGQIYVSPSTSSVASGSNVTVAVRVAPTTGVDTVQANLTYDATKLQFVSYDTSASPFTVPFSQTNSSGVVNVQLSAPFTTPATLISSDSLVVSVTFKALASSGSTALGLTGGGATQAETSGVVDSLSLVGGTVNFTAAASTGGGGPTGGGTTSGGSSSGSGSSSSSGGTTKSTTGATTTNTSTITSTTPSTTTPTATPPTITGTTTTASFTQATVACNTSEPSVVFVKYGTNKSLLTSATAKSALGTSHTLTFNPSDVIPGTTYYYSIVATNAAGAATSSPVYSLTTKGYTLKITVTDRHHKVLKNAKVTLHSVATTAETNSQGVVTFTNTAPGLHHLDYTSGSKVVTEALTVNNTVLPTATVQNPPAQNVAIVFPVDQPGSMTTAITVLLLLIVVIAAGFLFRRRLALIPAKIMPQHSVQQSNVDMVNPVVTMPSTPASETPALTTVTPIDTPPKDDSSATVINAEKPGGSTDPLNNIPPPSVPAPGSTIIVKSPNDTDEK